MTRGTKHDNSAGRKTLDADPWQVGGYRILRRLGEGGMGVVYLAEGPSRTQVAVKVIHRHLASDPEFRRRFRREVSATQRVARFSTAPVLDADVDGDTAYLVTEYVPGPTLFEAVKNQGPLSGSSLEGLAISVAVALRAIHAADVIHRDLKPSNVLLSPVGPKVIDFGLAYVSDSSTHSIAVMGTPAYMSPEHVRGLDITPSSDVFSWAGVVVFAACGKPPFGTGAGHEVLYRVVHDAPRIPRLDGVLGELVSRALSKEPTQRPTAAELVDALGSGGAGRFSGALVPLRETDHADTVFAGTDADAGTTESKTAVASGVTRARRGPRRSGRKRGRTARRWLWTGAGTATLALVTAGAVLASQAGRNMFGDTIFPGLSGQGLPGRLPSAEYPLDGGTARKLPGENPLEANGVKFYVQPDTDAARQARTWSAQGRTADASLMLAMSKVPQAMWLSGGSPDDVSRTVGAAATGAGDERTVPVFVTNNIPGKDCWNGGAGGTDAYRAWIDGVAKGIGSRPAVVVLEPSSLARIPGSSQCPQGGEAAAKQRYSDLSYAVQALSGLSRTAVYLDGGLDGWPGLTETADRLINAGMMRADGFYVNMVGYRTTQQSLSYAVRLSKCLFLKTASPAATCGNAELAAIPDDAPALPHFVIDSSRNGKGEWQPPAGKFKVPDEWCNPPGRGTGARPTTETGSPLADALLWLNSPGFSNGQCVRGTAGPADPLYGFVTPASGQWWPDLALDRAKNAVPPLTDNR